MTADGRKISTPTVENYLQSLINAFILYKVGRFDTKERKTTFKDKRKILSC
jgi:predicted AAA+ superfamily ATPase